MQFREIDHSKEIVGPHCGKCTFSLEADSSNISKERGDIYSLPSTIALRPVVQTGSLTSCFGADVSPWASGGKSSGDGLLLQQKLRAFVQHGAAQDVLSAGMGLVNQRLHG